MLFIFGNFVFSCFFRYFRIERTGFHGLCGTKSCGDNQRVLTHHALQHVRYVMYKIFNYYFFFSVKYYIKLKTMELYNYIIFIILRFHNLMFSIFDFIFNYFLIEIFFYFILVIFFFFFVFLFFLSLPLLETI